MLINTQEELNSFCKGLKGERFLALDTEFMRDRTYWPKLCLLQIAGERHLSAIDPLAGLDLEPVLELLRDPNILKVFHAARQDLEIFYHMTQQVPQPLADTQVMGMVTGYGEAASYESLVAKLAHAAIDKSSRFTDWSLRPLSERQLAYALDDVRHLRTVFEKLETDIKAKNREAWIESEMAVLHAPGTYRLDPDEAWQRLKGRLEKPRFFSIVKDLAAWREREAQNINIPRQRVIKDEALMEIAHHLPADAAALGRIRGLSPDFAKGRLGQGLMETIKKAGVREPDPLPANLKKKPPPSSVGPVVDMLKVLLRMVAEEEAVAARLIATTDDLEDIAQGRTGLRALTGWRGEIFGHKAQALKEGKLAMRLEGNRIKFVEIE